MQYVWPYMLDTYEKDIKFLKDIEAFISAEAEVARSPGWVCIPTFYFIFLTNKIIIRVFIFGGFDVISIKNWAGLSVCLIISIISWVLGRISACCGEHLFSPFYRNDSPSLSLPMHNWMPV